jgi:thymidine kinase
MPNLLAVAEFVTKVHAICAQTGELASFSYRLNPNQSQLLLGEKDHYEARSRKAFYSDQKKSTE